MKRNQRRCMRSLFALVLILSALSAGGEQYDDRYVDGHLLYEQLLRGNSGAVGYILGINDGIQIVQVHVPSADRLFCTPTGVRGGELADAVRRYLEADPAIRDFPAGILVVRALALMFPCNKT